MPGDADRSFDGFVANADYPMFIVTARAGEHFAGCLVGFATQISIDPRRFLVCVSQANHTHRIAVRATHLAVHLVERHQSGLASLFGGESGDDVDKFARCAWDEGPHGLPILRETSAWFAGPIVDRFTGGDHTGFVLAPEFGPERQIAVEPLRFTTMPDIEPGHDA